MAKKIIFVVVGGRETGKTLQLKKALAAKERFCWKQCAMYSVKHLRLFHEAENPYQLMIADYLEKYAQIFQRHALQSNPDSLKIHNQEN